MLNNINIKDILLSLIISLLIVLTCLFFDLEFFFFDDAQNEFYPFMREIGRSWISGEIPFILKDTFIGTNTMLDIHRAIFLPQNILLSILSIKLDNILLISALNAICNIFIISFSAIKLSRVIQLPKYLGGLLAILLSINPIFLYFYLESWWNAAAGHAWFIASLVSVILLRVNFSYKYLILNAVCVTSLMLSGWPHSAVAYFIISFIFIINLLMEKKYKKLIVFFIISSALVMIILPNYSEYIISSKLVERNSVLGNFQNFLVTGFNQLLIPFNPGYYNFMNTFGGYKLVNIPLSYASIYSLIFICFSNLKFKEVFNDKIITLLLAILLIFFILTQTPSAFGPLRWPFRFVPFYSSVLVLLSVYIFSKGLVFTKNRILVFSIVLLVSSILSIFSQEGISYKIIVYQLIFLCLTFSFLFLIKKNKLVDISSYLYTYGCLILILAFQHNADGYLSKPGIKNSINFENNFSKGGYLLSLTNGRNPKDHIEDLHSAQFLSYGIKAINGASPVGNKALAELLSTRFSQAFFNISETIKNLSNTSYGNCYFDYFNIDTIVINKDEITDDIKNRLYKCDFEYKDVRNQFVSYFIRTDNSNGTGISFNNNKSSIIDVNKYSNLEEHYIIDIKGPTKIVFSRPFWYGYKVYINSLEYPIENFKGLISLNVNDNFDNASLELNYFPKSWSYSLWIALIGLVILISTILYSRRNYNV